MTATNIADDTVHHPAGTADLAVLAEIRRQSAPFKGALSVPDGRPGYDEIFEATRPAAGVSYERWSGDGLTGVWCRVLPARTDAVLLYLHGGGYGLGSAWAYRHFAGQFAGRTGVDAFVLDYPLAPEHPFPAALDAAKSAYAMLAARGYGKIAIVGDSAGGGLALSLLAAVSAAPAGGAPIPACAVAMSPWTDLTLAGTSLDARADDEFYLDRPGLEAFARSYLSGHDPRDPAASPQHGALAGLPPLQIHVGTAEILLSDSEDYAAKAKAAGAPLVLHVWEAMPHVFQSSFDLLEGAEAAMELMAAFLRAELAR